MAAVLVLVLLFMTRSNARAVPNWSPCDSAYLQSVGENAHDIAVIAEFEFYYNHNGSAHLAL